MPSRLLAAIASAAGAVALVAPAHGSTFDARSLAISSDGQRVYAGQEGRAFSIISRDGATGLLSPFSAYDGSAPTGAFGRFGSRDIAVSADNKHVYSSHRGDDSVLQAEVTAGGLVHERAYKHGLDGITAMKTPHGLLILGNDLYVAAYSSEAVAHFEVDPGTGDLTFQASLSIAGASGAAELAGAPDGRFVYVGASGGGPIIRVARDTTTGVLSFPENAEGGQGAGMAMSRDEQGAYLYQADPVSDQILVHARDSLSGELTSAGSVQEGVGGVAGLDGVDSLAISADNENLYATARDDNTLVTFARDTATGELTPQSVKRDGVEGVDGLNDASTVVLSPDDQFVYVAGPSDNGVAAFRRSATTGEPTFLQYFTDALAPPCIGCLGSNGQPGAGGASAGLDFAGNDGISINGGDSYTNDEIVTLVVRAPTQATSIRLSNDGGFARPKLRSLPATRLKWRLDSTGSERLPKTVYARFAGPSGASSLSFTDDIILDQTQPKVVRAKLLSSKGSSARSAVASAAATKRRIKYLVSLRARDNASGVARVQVTHNKKRPGPAKRFRKRVRFSGQPRRAIFVRVTDRAGNRSAWRRVGR